MLPTDYRCVDEPGAIVIWRLRTDGTGIIAPPEYVDGGIFKTHTNLQEKSGVEG